MKGNFRDSSALMKFCVGLKEFEYAFRGKLWQEFTPYLENCLSQFLKLIIFFEKSLKLIPGSLDLETLIESTLFYQRLC